MQWRANETPASCARLDSRGRLSLRVRLLNDGLLLSVFYSESQIQE